MTFYLVAGGARFIGSNRERGGDAQEPKHRIMAIALVGYLLPAARRSRSIPSRSMFRKSIVCSPSSSRR